MLDTVKDNPIPSLIAGLSIGWLMSKSSSSDGRRSHSRAGFYDYNYETGFGEPRYRESGDGSNRPAGERVSETAQQAGESAQEYTRQARESAREYTRQAQHRVREQAGDVQRTARRSAGQVERMVEENPLGAGLATLALGAFAGLMVPSTRREDEMMGETRDRVVHQAQETARDTAERARNVAEKTAEEAQKTAQEETKRQMEQQRQEPKEM